MFKTNYHSHSDFCDGTGKLEDYVKSAIDRGFHVFGFSGHAPLPFKNDWTMSQSRVKEYLDEAKRLKYKYKDSINIKTGLEVDYIEERMSPSDQYLQDYALDYTIGSVHVIPDKITGEYLGIDYTKNEIEQLINNSYNGNAELLVKEYYRLIRNMSDKKGFDIIGHLDVIKKTNINSIYFNETEYWYKNEIIDTLQSISENKQILEINTGQILNDPRKISPSQWILKIAYELNIPVTLNSDAHRPDRVDNYFDEAKKIIKDAGYRYVSILIKNKWENQKIS